MFNKSCSESDYKAGTMKSGFKCSKTSEEGTYKYRAIGNPGDIHFNSKNVVTAEGLNYYRTNTDTVARVPAYRESEIEQMRNDQIKNYERAFTYDLLMDRGVIQRIASLWTDYSKKYRERIVREYIKDLTKDGVTFTKSEIEDLVSKWIKETDKLASKSKSKSKTKSKSKSKTKSKSKSKSKTKSKSKSKSKSKKDIMRDQVLDRYKQWWSKKEQSKLRKEGDLQKTKKQEEIRRIKEDISIYKSRLRQLEIQLIRLETS